MSKLFETKTVWKVVDDKPQKCTLLTPAKGTGYMLLDKEGKCLSCSGHSDEPHDVSPTKGQAIKRQEYLLKADIKRNARWLKESEEKLAALQGKK